jgi:excisionase family DNA binding protein
VYLGVSLATIRRWTDAGHLGCYRTPGGQRRFSRDQLDRFLATLHSNGAADRSERIRSENGFAQRAVVA